MTLGFSLERRKLLKKLERCEEQLRSQPRDPQLWIRHAEAAFAADEPVRALASYRSAASLLKGNGSWARAAAVLKRALEIDPNENSLQLELQEVTAQRRVGLSAAAVPRAEQTLATLPPGPFEEEEGGKTEVVSLDVAFASVEEENTSDMEVIFDADESGGFSLETGLPEGFEQEDLPDAITAEMILPGPPPPREPERPPRRIISVRRRDN